MIIVPSLDARARPLVPSRAGLGVKCMCEIKTRKSVIELLRAISVFVASFIGESGLEIGQKVGVLSSPRPFYLVVLVTL